MLIETNVRGGASPEYWVNSSKSPSVRLMG